MRNAKKLLLLVLSLMLLIGVFAVAALAEDAPATVVYPDGSVETYAVGETISPKAITDGLYYGQGNTLFKDDATEGWIFTVDGAALADLTVTADMAGKQIIASGVDKVYYTSEEKISTGTTMVYHLVNDADRFMSSYNQGDRGDGTNTGASSRDVLGLKTTTYIVLVLYEDVVTDNFCMNLMPANNRQYTSISFYIDLNGHTVINNYAGGTTEILGAALRLYSSKPGAKWYQPNTTSAFYASDDGSLCLGNNSFSNATYSDNISVYVKDLFAGHWGGGASITGGHIYQLPGGSKNGFVSVSRRVNYVQNASFYPLAGASVFSDNISNVEHYEIGKSEGTAIENCKFYGSDDSFILTATNSSYLYFKNCTFYGLQATNNGKGSVDATTHTNTTENAVAAVSYKTLTRADGRVAYFCADTLEETKAYAELATKDPAPYGKWVDGEYFVALNPIVDLTYDENLNATEKILDGELSKVYFTTTTNGVITYNTSAETHASDFVALMNHLPKSGATIVLYSDITVPGLKIMGTTNKYHLDINGYRLTVTGNARGDAALSFNGPAFYLYSSKEGGVIDASASSSLFWTNDDEYNYDGVAQYAGATYFGESETSGTAYGKNLTAYCKILAGGSFYGAGLYIVGGNFVQVGTASSFLNFSSRCYACKDATFVLTNSTSAVVGSYAMTYSRCTFVYEGIGYANLVSSSYANSPTFDGCSFINVIPNYNGTSVPTYNTCAFGTTSFFPTQNLNAAGAAYLAHGASSKSVTANGVTYVVDGVLVSSLDGYSLVTFKGAAAEDIVEYWANDAEIVLPEGLVYNDLVNHSYKKNPKILSKETTEDGMIVTVAFDGVDDWAFTYSANGATIYVTMSDCGDTAQGIGDKFYELFSVPAAGYEIVMYKDMHLTKGVHFGALVKTSDSYNRDYYASFANGSITWDLNGTTVTIDKDVTGVANLAAANHAVGTPNVPNAYSPAVFGFEHPSTSNGLFLKSSKAGAQIINESSASIFGIGEGKTPSLTIYGANITMISMNARVLNSIEVGGSNQHKIYGGTYISGAASGVVRISGGAIIEDATFINTNASAERMLHLDGYRSGTIALKNVTFASAKQGAPAIGVVNGSQKYHITAENCIFAGAAVPVAGGRFTTVTYTGTHLVPNAADLSTVYASAPADTTVAASSVKVNGVDYKVYGYFASTTGFVTVEIPLASLTELWVAGSTFLAPTYDANINVVEKDGKIYYRENPVWVAKIDGVIVEDVLAAANAGKTAIVDIDGALELVYAIRDIAGVKTYYYGENVAAELMALFANMGPSNSVITFYEDITLTTSESGGVVMKSGGEKVSHYVDLNGHTLTILYTASVENPLYGLYFKNGSTFVYSSVPGAVIDVSLANLFMMTDSGANAYVGETANDGSTTYGKNLTVLCQSVFGSRLWSNNGYIIGGTYIQKETTDIDRMFAIDDGPVATIRNSTFIAEYYSEGFFRSYSSFTVTGCTFVAKNPTKLVSNGSGAIGATFNNCYFYNVTPNIPTKATVSYTDCHFDTASLTAQNGGYIAFTGAPVVKNVNGANYTFAAKFVADATLVEWGFGISEYWVNGATASHADVVVDGLFAYGFDPFVVGEGEAEATLIAIKPGTVQMYVTLQSQIKATLVFSDALIGATIQLGDASVVLSEDLLALSKSFAPNEAYGASEVAIVIGGNTHVITVSIESYAETLLGSDAYASVHNLTYAMIEYVRSMIPAEATFCAGVSAPTGYEAQTLLGEASDNDGVLLESISFCLDGTIAIAIQGTKDAVGKSVNLVLATGRSEWATVNEAGIVLFEGLYINEFFGEMTISVAGETYSYSLANYLNGLTAEKDQAGVQALYNYAFYADAYVRAQTAN